MGELIIDALLPSIRADLAVEQESAGRSGLFIPSQADTDRAKRLREAVPALLAEVDRLREQNQRFASRLGGYATTMQAELDPLFQMLGKLRALVSDWQANSGSRALGDPTAATWDKAAQQLLRVLDGKDEVDG